MRIFVRYFSRSNNTNNYNPQEPDSSVQYCTRGSNNTNNYNPQELRLTGSFSAASSNNTNNYNPQELHTIKSNATKVQIIPITTILKNASCSVSRF